MTERTKLKKRQKNLKINPKNDLNYLYLLLLGIRLLPHSAKTQGYIIDPLKGSKPIICETKYLHIYVARVVPSTGRILTMNLDRPSVEKGGENRFIETEEPGVYKYATFKPGSVCYSHKDPQGGDINPFFAFLLEKADPPGNQCKVSYILTNKDVQICTDETNGKSQYLSAILQFKEGSKTYTQFRRISTADDNLYERFMPRVYKINDLKAEDVDNDLVEMLLAEPFSNPDSNSDFVKINLHHVNTINSLAENNDFVQKIKIGDFAKRIVFDDLPGYLIHPDDPGTPIDSSENSISQFLTAKTAESETIHIQLYIEKTKNLVFGGYHELQFKTYSHKKFGGAASNIPYLAHLYKIRLSRLNSEAIRLEWIDEDNHYPSKTVLTDKSKDKFLYLSFGIGTGILYFKDPETVRVATYISTHATRVGLFRKSTIKRLAEKDLKLNQLYRVDRDDQSAGRVLKIQYKTKNPEQGNLIGLRVISASAGRGSFYKEGFNGRDDSSMTERCYEKGLEPRQCFSLAILAKKSEKQAPFTRAGLQVHQLDTGSDLGRQCSVVYSGNDCVIPKDDFVTNMEKTATNRLYGGLGPLEKFESMPEEEKNFFYQFENNLGRLYLIGCPDSCKFRFFRFFTFLLFFKFFDRWEV